jgi:hypothetical protein
MPDPEGIRFTVPGLSPVKDLPVAEGGRHGNVTDLLQSVLLSAPENCRRFLTCFLSGRP